MVADVLARRAGEYHGNVRPPRRCTTRTSELGAASVVGGSQAQLWKYARQIGKMGYRKAAVEVIFELPSGESAVVHKSGSRSVVLQGEPAELLLHAFGRNEVKIEAKGELADVQSVMALDRSF